jgi:hypothetical protein
MISLHLPLTRRLLAPVLKVKRPSVACERVLLDFGGAVAAIEWKSGHMSGHRCRRRDMLRLLIPGTSLGQWANRHCLQRHDAVSV